jgi:two-component system OmpR family response regulator
VLDVMLPGLDGFEVVSRLLAEEVWTPVLMLTAGRRRSPGPRLNAGADDYLTRVRE